MATRWIYDTAGKQVYHQDGKHIYATPTATCEFCENGGWWYQMESGAAAYYVKNDRVFTPNGMLVFYYAWQIAPFPSAADCLPLRSPKRRAR
jgi:hypothetical protein